MCIRDSSYATANMAGAAALWLSYHGKAVLQGKARARGMSLSLIHISEPTRLLSISYAVFCLKKK